MFVQILSMIRNNEYLIYREHYGKKSMHHKRSALAMIRYLMNESAKTFGQGNEFESPSKSIAVRSSSTSVSNLSDDFNVPSSDV